MAARTIAVAVWTIAVAVCAVLWILCRGKGKLVNNLDD